MPRNLLCMPSFWKLYKVLYLNIICFYFRLPWLYLLHWLTMFFCWSQSSDLNIYTVFNHSTNVSTILMKFIKIFHAFLVDNNFCFFEYANELVHVHIHVTSFMELSCFILKAFWNSWWKSLKKLVAKFILVQLQARG